MRSFSYFYLRQTSKQSIIFDLYNLIQFLKFYKQVTSFLYLKLIGQQIYNKKQHQILLFLQFAMYNHAQGDSSINDILDMMKHFKLESQKSKDSYSIDFQSKNSSRSHFKEVRPRSPLSNITNTRVNNTNNSYHSNVFQKLYDQKKQMDRRKCLMQYETRRSKQQREKSQCTFSPNIKKKLRTQQYDSIDNESFYNKNVEWLQRKEKSIKIKQCEKNQENVVKLTFTPKINKFNKAKVVDNGVSIYQAKGVQDYLNRQKKVKKIQEFVQTRKKNPYSHVWNVKKGHFSHVV